MFIRTPTRRIRQPKRTTVCFDTPPDASITLTLKLSRDDAHTLCRAISRALRREVEVYLSERDRISGQATLQFLLRENEPDKVMEVVMQTVPQAEFGYLQHVCATAVH